MVKQLKIYSTLLCLTLTSQAIYSQSIRVKFQVAQLSVNVAEGTTELMPNFIVISDTLNIDSVGIDSLDLIDFPSIIYDDIASFSIEKRKLSSGEEVDFTKLTSFDKTLAITEGSTLDHDFVKGATYAFRLIAISKTGQKMVLMNKSVSVSIADPRINCAKFNATYRKSCHNCFQDNIIPTAIGGIKTALGITRVIELDIYSSKVLGGNNASGIWNVRHGPKLDNNVNNCGDQSGFGIVGRSFNICLQDVIDWHNDPAHAGHDPITIFIDLKESLIGNQAFWRAGHNPVHLDVLLKTVGIQNIYTPKELGGSVIDLRLNAQHNNWPSMGDLKDKFIFVLTGTKSLLDRYVNELGIDGVAFIGAKSTSVVNASLLDDITDKDKVVFYNIRGGVTSSLHHDHLNVAHLYTYPNNYISRVTTTEVLTGGTPDDFTEDNYRKTIQFQVNCPAPRNIWENFSHHHLGVYYPENGIFDVSPLNHISLTNDHIFSSYQNVTQAAKQTIAATNLIVESGTHYRMIAGNNIKLKSGTLIKAGSDTKIRIDVCEGANYSLRPTGGIDLEQDEIDAIMHELDKELYNYQPSDENEVVNIGVYPNPTTGILNINYTNYLVTKTRFILSDLTGRVVLTQNYQNQQEGKQHFSININELKAGTYFYTLQVGEQNYNGKVVKME